MDHGKDVRESKGEVGYYLITQMKKQRISRVMDTLETLGEIPKRAVAETLKTFNPLEALHTTPSPHAEAATSTEKKPPTDHTPLNLDKVKGEHDIASLHQVKETDDQKKLRELRSRLFHRVKGEEDQAIKAGARAEQQEKEQELTEEQQEQQEIQRRLAARQNADAPQGKEARGGLFGKKKKRTSNAVTENFAEMRGSGKH